MSFLGKRNYISPSLINFVINGKQARKKEINTFSLRITLYKPLSYKQNNSLHILEHTKLISKRVENISEDEQVISVVHVSVGDISNG